MRKILMTGLFVLAVVGLASATDRDRHADYTNPKAASAAAAKLPLQSDVLK